MPKHAESLLTDDAEIARLLVLALNSPEHAGSLRLEQAVTVGRSEMLGRWSVDTPEGQVQRVALVRMLDGEPLHEDYYRDESDAIAVFDHLVERSAIDRFAPGWAQAHEVDVLVAEEAIDRFGLVACKHAAKAGTSPVQMLADTAQAESIQT